MNDLERKIRELLEGHEGEEEQESASLPASNFALNDNRSLARALGADTLDGTTL